MHFYYMIPLSALLADAAMIAYILSLKKRHDYEKALLLFYITFANWNIGVTALYLVQTEEQAKFALYLMHHLHCFIPAAFLEFSARLSGRQNRIVWQTGYLVSFLVLFIVEYSFWFTGDTFFIRGVQKFSWGYYPLNGPGTRIFTLLFLYTIPTGLYFLFRPAAKAAIHLPVRRIGFYFLILWIGAFTNFLPLAGIDIYPAGNAFDTIVSTAVGMLIYRSNKMERKQRIRLQAAGILSALAISIIFSWILAEFGFLNTPLSMVLYGILGSLAGTVTFFLLFYVRKSTVIDNDIIISVLRNHYDLSKQEAYICLELSKGSPRKNIVQKFQIQPTTLKIHLTSIYQKTIDRDNDQMDRKGREKLQKLTVFLNNLIADLKEQS